MRGAACAAGGRMRGLALSKPVGNQVTSEIAPNARHGAVVLFSLPGFGLFGHNI